MQCPVCMNEMKEGLLRIKGTLLGFLLFHSFKNLYFGDLCILRHNERRGGYRCDQCETVVMPSEPEALKDKRGPNPKVGAHAAPTTTVRVEDSD